MLNLDTALALALIEFPNQASDLFALPSCFKRATTHLCQRNQKADAIRYTYNPIKSIQNSKRDERENNKTSGTHQRENRKVQFVLFDDTANVEYWQEISIRIRKLQSLKKHSKKKARKRLFVYEKGLHSIHRGIVLMIGGLVDAYHNSAECDECAQSLSRDNCQHLVQENKLRAIMRDWWHTGLQLRSGDKNHTNARATHHRYELVSVAEGSSQCLQREGV
ncbi:hypothetical protein OUZ56_027889 [Daphnia magna]|uniref:Uncharacterized protein n=1 Tax=Daphnia magna TaxID=35525 RepID=A0ABR0B2V8_9CRUS|nr:hypothetical protein OUZ56_027889 [Daphnia magna]